MRAARPTYLGFDRHRAHWGNIYYKAVKELDRLQVGPAFPPVATGRRPVRTGLPASPDGLLDSVGADSVAPGTASTQPRGSRIGGSPSGTTATPSNQTPNSQIGFDSQNTPADPPVPAADHFTAPEVSADTSQPGTTDTPPIVPATPSNQTSHSQIGFDSQNTPADPPVPAADHSAEPEVSANISRSGTTEAPSKPPAAPSNQTPNSQIGFDSQNTLNDPPQPAACVSEVSESAEAQLRAGTPAIAALRLKQKPRMPRHLVKRRAARRYNERLNSTIGFVSQAL
jgi:hypothetical protein